MFEAKFVTWKKEDCELRVLAKLENGAFLAVQGLSFAFQCGFDPWSGS